MQFIKLEAEWNNESNAISESEMQNTLVYSYVILNPHRVTLSDTNRAEHIIASAEHA